MRPGFVDIHVVETSSTTMVVSLCDSFGLKREPTSVKNPQGNAILERIHQTLANMMRTAELDMVDTADPSDVADFLNDAA
jgi:hypothetical protein